MANSSFSLDYSRFDGSKQRRHSVSFAQRFPSCASRLGKLTPLPEFQKLLEKRKKLGKSEYFIRFDKTSTTEGQEFLDEFERWHITYLHHTLKIRNSAESSMMMERLLTDPVGVQDPPYSDAFSWTATQSVQVRDADDDTPATAVPGPVQDGPSSNLRPRPITTTTAARTLTETRIYLAPMLHILGPVDCQLHTLASQRKHVGYVLLANVLVREPQHPFGARVAGGGGTDYVP